METQNTGAIEQVENTTTTTTAAQSQTQESAEKPAVQEGSRFDHVKETLELLYGYFPKAFIKEGNCRPLKVGIFEDLKVRIADKDDLSLSKVRAALRLYTTRLRYLFSVKEGAARIDLDGNECEVVSAEHAQYAQERFKEINSKRKALKPQKLAKNPKNTKKPYRKDQKSADKKPIRSFGNKAEISDLKKGTAVIVLSSERHFVRGTVAEDAVKDNVSVTLSTGLTISLPLARVQLPKAAKQ